MSSRSCSRSALSISSLEWVVVVVVVVFRGSSSAQTSMTTSPTSVNLTALMRRFSSTCCRRFGSPRTSGGQLSAMV